MTKAEALGTTRIGVNPATNAFHALRYARAAGSAINYAATINWDRLGIDDETATRLFRELRCRVRRRWKHLRETLGLPVGHLDDIGSHENPLGLRNTNWLVYVPPLYVPEFERTVTDRLGKLSGVPELGQALHFQPTYAVGSYAKYVLKGVDPAYALYFRMRAVDQGFIAGRGRTFVARRLSWSARKAAGWKPKVASTKKSQENETMKQPGLDGRHRDTAPPKAGEIQQKRSDTLNKNLSRPIPQFSLDATLGDMRDATGKVSEDAVRRAAAKSEK